jgi:hypothetical protein
MRRKVRTARTQARLFRVALQVLIMHNRDDDKDVEPFPLNSAECKDILMQSA